MKKMCALVALAGLCGAAQAAQTYTDSLNDVNVGGDSPNWNWVDIDSVTMTNDATNVYVSIKMRGNGADWAKYGMQIDIDGDVSGSTLPGWNRPNIGSAMLMDKWIGTWADGGGGGQLWDYTGTWNQTGSLAPDYSNFFNGNSEIKWTISLAWLGLSIGDSFAFDLVTTGGGDNDGGWDHLSNLASSSNDYGALSNPGDPLVYRVIPTPGSLALLGMGGLLAARRRR